MIFFLAFPGRGELPGSDPSGSNRKKTFGYLKTSFFEGFL